VGNVDDRKPSHAECHGVIRGNSLIVRAAVNHLVTHPIDQALAFDRPYAERS
jgi:hypothetical protein